MLVISQIPITDVDFFLRNGDKIEELKTKEDNGMYPPRFRVVIDCFPPANPLPARFQFTGAKEEVVFDVVLRPLPSSAPHTAGAQLVLLFTYDLGRTQEHLRNQGNQRNSGTNVTRGTRGTWNQGTISNRFNEKHLRFS